MREDIDMLRRLSATCARCGEHYVDAIAEVGEENLSTFLVQPVVLDGPSLPVLVDELVLCTEKGEHIADMLCDSCASKEFYRLRPTRKTTCCTQCSVGFQKGEPFAAICELSDVQKEGSDTLSGEEYPRTGPTDVYLCLSCLSEILEDAASEVEFAEDDHPITHIFRYAEHLGFWEFDPD